MKDYSEDRRWLAKEYALAYVGYEETEEGNNCPKEEKL